MLNELSDYFFINKIYDKIRIDNEGSLEQDNKFTFDQQIHRPINYKSSNLAYVPFVFDWVKNINSITNAKSCQLSVYYPPDSFFGWHTNDDCEKCYNMIATYSTSDKSYFETRKRKIYDTVGWSIKTNYFNSNSDWHRVISKGHRLTFAWQYDTQEKMNLAINKLKISGVQNWNSDI